MTPDEIARLRDLHAAAGQEPWEVFGNTVTFNKPQESKPAYWSAFPGDWPKAAYIADAYNLMPVILDEIEQLRATIHNKDVVLAAYRLEVEQLRTTLQLARGLLSETNHLIGIGYDWNADPGYVTLKQGEVFKAIAVVLGRTDHET